MMTVSNENTVNGFDWLVWCSGNVVCHMNKVTRARLVLGWVTMFGRVYHVGM